MNIQTIDYEGAQDLKLVLETLRKLLIVNAFPTLEIDDALGRIKDRINDIANFENGMRTVLMREDMHIVHTGTAEEPQDNRLKLVKDEKGET